MPLSSAQFAPVMCLTQDNLPLSHLEQAAQLCAAGATWIQLRMKSADATVRLAVAREVVALCHAHGALCIINDDLDAALASGADGVHLGRTDGAWTDARRRLGPDRLLGGTVNDPDDAARAKASGCLDYAGVGPWRFTATKQNLAPVLGAAGVRALIKHLNGLPAWAIGGIQAEDMQEVRATGATGAAVSSALFRGNAVEENYRAIAAGWRLQKILS